MKNLYLLYLLILFFPSFILAQMPVNGDTLYGNEWIRYGQSYYKIPVVQDGMYRITYETLLSSGFPVNTVAAEQLQLYHFGAQVHLYSTTQGTLVPGDYVAFYGRSNRGELDRFLYKNGEADMLNSNYSMFTDTAMYYLTYTTEANQPLRYKTDNTELNNLPSKEAWFWSELSPNNLNGGFVAISQEEASESTFEFGEGFGISQGIKAAYTANLKPVHRFAGAAADSFALRLVGIGTNPHYIQININNNLLNDPIISSSNEVWNRNFTYAQSSTASDVNIKLVDTTGRIGISQVKLVYQRIFNFENQPRFYFKINGNNTEKYLEIDNFQHGNSAPVLYDLTSKKRITTQLDGNKVKIKLTSFSGTHEFYLVNNSNGLTNATLSPVALNNFPTSSNNAEFIIITSKKLRGAAVDEYANYRRKNYEVAVVNVEDLYEQFAYGIQRHPLAIRNFGHYIKKNWRSARFVLILGKGQEFNYIRNYNATADARFFVPTFGYPGSDHLLLASNASQVPVLPVGRLAATNPQQIEMYLNKLKEYENPHPQNRSWRKEVVHLGGGKTANEQTSIESYMNSMQQILEQNNVGAEVYKYYKRSDDAVQRLDSDKINALIQQQGVGIITFFGHGGPNIIDISIGDPATFTNNQQYSIMFALGCDAGNIHFSNVSYSENFVFQPNRAGIAFIGTASTGFLSDLGVFQQTVYRNFGNDNLYNKSIGEVIQASLQSHDLNNSKFRRTLLQQYTLHGDPALRFAPFNAPDFLVEKESVQFQPNRVSVRDDSVELKFNVLNAGKYNPNDSLAIKVVRKLPNAVEKTMITKIKAPAFRTEQPISVVFPVADNSGSTAGRNNFHIELDPERRIDELPLAEAEQNNRYDDASLFIFDKGITPIEPRNYAIVNTAPFKLRASTASVFESEQRYKFQIDTSKYFDSPVRKDTTMNVTGGVLDWQPNITPPDSTALYWRVALDSLVEGDYNWISSSFTYIKNSSPGWRQGHFQQLQENTFSEMSLPDTTRQLQFSANASNVLMINYAGLSFLTHFTTVNQVSNIYLDQIGGGGIIAYVFDGASGDPWPNPYPGRFGSTYGNESWLVGYSSFPFSTKTPEWRSRLIHFLNDSIPDGNYVVLHTVQGLARGTINSYEPEEWVADSTDAQPLNLFNVLGNQGATAIQALRDTAQTDPLPYILFYRKGSGKVLYEKLADSVNDTISATFTVPGFKSQGSLHSRFIGPANKWSRMQQQFSSDNADSYGVNIYGIRADESQQLLVSNYIGADTTLEWISAETFPFLKLELQTQDSVKRTPAQLNYWQVLYEGIPEAALNPLALTQPVLAKDTLQEGEALTLKIPIANLSAYDMDSLLVRYTIISETNKAEIHSTRIQPLLRQDIIVIDTSLSTKGLRGKYQLVIDVNPDEDQPELYHFNNIGILNFFVQNDVRNPLVEVTFDGMRIMNGDIVSAKPQIVASVRDENRYLPLVDTSTFELKLLYPNQTNLDSAEHIGFEQLRFEPGKAGENNKATIYFEPNFTEDGTYTLLIQGRDASENKAGNVFYSVQFEVITESKISNVFNYPNPFSTSTQFVYTLTGAEPPSHYQIQIMTIAGRVVRELTELDLGPLRIGTHRTELAWDGTDQYGDRLANGVYLYRAIVKDQDGKDFEKYANDTDRFFKNKIGKLVLLR